MAKSVRAVPTMLFERPLTQRHNEKFSRAGQKVRPYQISQAV
ncbi:hypothetical protein OP10G_1944 [Fimbriimonas ginsengisoli Gsoil 348]|uniref:Uncharacterized protein n=1 Tax=Fimbriimonas ginsengisoli Gsoil 348 TaxID=661478 RepID=A0A068NPK8_FIMGI|nr:hypothetical protein OP10G_1944 [Fimbriimonas ginsengisoli Gsoil 348]